MANDTLTRLKKLQERVQAFFDEKGIERQDDARQPLLHRFAHFWLLVGKSFIRNRCPLRASALAYTTLLALVPMLAVGVGIMTTFLKNQGEEPVRKLMNSIVDNVAPALNLESKSDDPTATNKKQEVITKITDFIANIQSGTIGVTGTIALVFVAIGLLRTIEATFNDIWGITHGRGWFASIVQYWATISVGPIFLVVALGLTSGPHFAQTALFIEGWPFIAAVLFKLLPIVVLSLAFALFYKLMPNTKVQPLAALVGGVVGGTLWYLNNTFSIMYASNAVTYSKIYGALGILPLFLVGMYLSWLILLFGAQVAYAYQNRQSYLQERQAEGVNQRCREFVALRLMTNVAQHFQRGACPPGVNQLAAALGVPSRLITHLIQPLVQAKLVVEVLDTEAGFTPARPLNQITAHDILIAFRVGQGLELETCEDGTRGFVRNRFISICDAEKRVADDMTLEALANEAPAVPVTAGVAQSA